MRLKNKLIELLGGVPQKEFDDFVEASVKQFTEVNTNIALAYKNNDYLLDLNVLRKYFFNEAIAKSEIKYVANTTKLWKDDWIYPKRCMPMHNFLKYDNKKTETMYKDLAASIILSASIDEVTFDNADDLVFWFMNNFIERHNPQQNYASDLKKHKLTEVWESPFYLYDKIQAEGESMDCDSYAMHTHNLLYEMLLLKFPGQEERLQLAIVRLPNDGLHMLNLWLKGDNRIDGVGIMPLESTYEVNQFRKDWELNRFITKQRYDILKGFNRDYEWYWRA